MSASSQILEQEMCGTSALSLRGLLVPGCVLSPGVSFSFAEGLLCFLLSPLIRAAYLGPLAHLHSAHGGDVPGDCPGTWDVLVALRAHSAKDFVPELLPE